MVKIKIIRPNNHPSQLIEIYVLRNFYLTDNFLSFNNLVLKI